VKKIRRSAGDQTFTIINMSLFGLFALICCFPFYYLLINTISNNREVALGHILFLPSGIHFANYTQVFQLRGLFNATVVSINRTVIGTVLSVLSASYLGYCMTKEYFWHRTFWYRYLIITMYFSAGLIPWYLTMHALRLNNNFLAYVWPSLCQSFNVVLVKTYVESLPLSLEESAEIDGAGCLRRYMSIVLPLSTPILATIAIFSAIGHWNSYSDTLFLMTKENLYTLQYILFKYMRESETISRMLQMNLSGAYGANAADLLNRLTPTAVKYTVTAVVTLPILFVYPFFQRYFVKGIMIGAVKG
jgi:ABC-type glycerol-3-phosphate transport system permease component